MLQRVLVCLLSSLCLCAQADNLRLVTGDGQPLALTPTSFDHFTS